MPLGMANGVVAPAAAGTPSWLHALMFDGIGIWNNHPIALAVGTAWIQVGIGLLLIVSNATIGRIAAAVSVAGPDLSGWSATVRAESSNRPTQFCRLARRVVVLSRGRFMACVADGELPRTILALHAAGFERAGRRRRTVAVSAVAGFWHGGDTNAMTVMTSTMTATPQPHALAWIVRHFGDFAAPWAGLQRHGHHLLGVCAAGLWIASERDLRWPTRAFVIGCLFFWVVAQDVPLWEGSRRT